MAEFKRYTYSNTGTEIEFMQGLIDLICGLDEDITVEDADGNPTTAADQYADTTKYATFIFKFGGAKMPFVRNRRVSESQSAFDYYPNYPTTNPYTLLRTAYNNYAFNAEATREIFIAFYKSENVKVLYLGSYNITAISGAGVSAILIKADGEACGAVGSGTDPLNNALTGSTMTASYSPIFAYSAGAGKVDFIEKAVFTSGGEKAFEMEDIKSCSTMPVFASVALPDGRNFFTIAPNAMVEIEAEEY